MSMIMWMRAWWYRRIATKKIPPAAIRRYLMKSGLNDLKGVELPAKLKIEIAAHELSAALDPDFAEIEADLFLDGTARLGEIPTVKCARCRRPIFTHEAHAFGGEQYCEVCRPMDMPPSPQPTC